MALYCMVCHCIAWNGVVWCCMAWWSWCCMVWQRIALHRLYGVALYVMVWHSIAWFAVLFVHEHCCWDSRFGVLPRRAITLFIHYSHLFTYKYCKLIRSIEVASHGPHKLICMWSYLHNLCAWFFGSELMGLEVHLLQWQAPMGLVPPGCRSAPLVHHRHNIYATTKHKSVV